MTQPQLLPWFICIHSTIILIIFLSLQFVFIIYVNIFIVIFIENFCDKFLSIAVKKSICYFIFITSLLVVHNFDSFVPDHQQNLLIQVSFSWLNAKLLSLALDSIEEYPRTKTFDSILLKLAYLMYFPPFFFGPIYHFDDFSKSMRLLSRDFEAKVIVKNAINLIRFIFWALILEIILHFLYSSAFQFYLFLSESFDLWTLCGFGYSLMLLFYLKYFVIYGISRQLAILDGLEDVIAPPPQCIVHIHQTTFLWRTFDRGLYLFLQKYFYKILTRSQSKSIFKKFFAGLFCFTLIALWHGYDLSINIWIGMNIALFLLEISGSYLNESSFFKNFDPRIKAAFGSPHLLLAYISMIFFLSNHETGILFLRKIVLSFSFAHGLILIVLYLICNLSQTINSKEI
ncbi:uncharacterized protein NH340_JMT02698 [Sarcoptes scabiei]|nr:uncharacterized protein NH340_JMT02698 [Sarcoptes scabiei]